MYAILAVMVVILPVPAPARMSWGHGCRFHVRCALNKREVHSKESKSRYYKKMSYEEAPESYCEASYRLYGGDVKDKNPTEYQKIAEGEKNYIEQKVYVYIATIWWIEIMIDFEEMLEKEFQEKPINPIEIFQEHRNKKYEYLRGGQEHVLETWFNQRTQKDTIVKMDTGSGKTLVGLLMLQSCLNENLGPAIYLCVDNQLVDQVVASANDFSISNVTFEDGSIPLDFLNSQAILITTFDKLVNGLSKFGVKDTDREEVLIGSLLVDDAHSGLKKARQAFTISLDRNKHSDICDRLAQSQNPVIFDFFSKNLTKHNH